MVRCARVLTGRRNRLLITTLWTAVCGALIAWQLFCPPIAGVADNRDFWRVLQPTGLVYRHDMEQTVFKWAELSFGWGTRSSVRYLTSEVLFTRAACVLSPHLFGASYFDIRALGIVHLAVYLLAVWLLIATLAPRHLSAQCVVGALAVTICADGRSVSYFQSMYSESASLIFAVWMTASALVACRHRDGATGWLAYAAFILSSCLFSIAKTQNLVFLPALVVPAFVLFPTLPAAPRMRTLLAVATAMIFIALPIWEIRSNAYAATKGVNVAVHLHEELFPHSHTPHRDAYELGIVHGDESTVGLGDLARFYVRHPRRWWDLVERNSAFVFKYIPYGNFACETGKPAYSIDHRFDPLSQLELTHAPRSPASLLAVAAAIALVWGLRARRGTADSRRRALLVCALLAGCAAELIATVTFEANGPEKHLFIFNVVAHLVLLATVAEAPETRAAA